MGRPKKNLEQQPDVQETGLVYEIKEIKPTIHDKYRKYINQSKSNYLTGIQYPEIIEILRWCENKINKPIPINVSCGQCVLDLIILFRNLELYDRNI